MVKCSFCGREIEGLAHRCHRCTGSYCDTHRLPEDHNCPGLEKEKSKIQERWKRAFKSSFQRHEKKDESTAQHKRTSPFKKWCHKFKYWLTDREYQEYRDSRFKNYVFPLLIKFIVSLIAIIIIYSNLKKFNDVSLWIIKLGSTLFLIALFFLIKYSIKILSEIWNWTKRQRNWLKYLIVIFLLILLWQVYANRTTVLNPLFDYYNQTNFSVFFPLDIKNFTWKDKASFNYGEDKKITVPTSIKATMDVSKMESKILVLVNNERANNGARTLISTSYMSDLARKHSQRMINEDFFEHSTYNLGENIGEVPIWVDVIGCGSTYSDDSVAECFVSGWISSPGHHTNMIDKSYFSTGIGVACDNSKCRATEVFS